MVGPADRWVRPMLGYARAPIIVAAARQANELTEACYQETGYQLRSTGGPLTATRPTKRALFCLITFSASAQSWVGDREGVIKLRDDLQV